jgi:phosphoglycolate phosphatase-like HAD superfamily hydrolase
MYDGLLLDHDGVIVSNNQTRIVEGILDHHGLLGRFDTIRAREPTPASLEPDPTYEVGGLEEVADILSRAYTGRRNF